MMVRNIELEKTNDSEHQMEERHDDFEYRTKETNNGFEHQTKYVALNTKNEEIWWLWMLN